MLTGPSVTLVGKDKKLAASRCGDVESGAGKTGSLNQARVPTTLTLTAPLPPFRFSIIEGDNYPDRGGFVLLMTME